MPLSSRLSLELEAQRARIEDDRRGEESALRKLADRYGDEPETWYELSSAYDLSRKTTEALEAIDRAIHLSPRDPIYHRLKAEQLTRLSKVREAQAALAEAERLGDGQSDEQLAGRLLMAKGRLAIKTKDWPEARARLEAAAAIFSRRGQPMLLAEARFNIAQTWQLEGRFAESGHEAFKGKVAGEACFVVPDSSGPCVCPTQNGSCAQATGSGAGAPCPYPGCGHGTNVAGIAAGRGPDGAGVARGANLVAIQVCAQHTTVEDGRTITRLSAYESDMVRALDYVDTTLMPQSNQTGQPQMKIAAVNLSFSGTLYTDEATCTSTEYAFADTIGVLLADGIPVVVASGNNGQKNAIGAPACVQGSVSVGAVNDQDIVYADSNSMTGLDLLAPGGTILTARSGVGGFELASGTSMATPHVAGAIAVLRQKLPNDSVALIVDQLLSTGVPVLDTNGVTTPRLCLGKAVTGTGCPDPCHP